MSANPRIFSLDGRGLKLNTRSDIEPFLKDVDPTVIEEIHLGGNTLGVEASQALAEFLERTTVLKVADFADIFTGRLISEIPQALSALCDALISKTTLVEINLSDNAFGGRSVDPMVPFLSKNRSFQVLKLNNNGLGPAGGKIIADALFESARASAAAGTPSNLRTVICGRNRLEDGSADAWAAAFRAHGGLREIRMPQNGIRMDGITSLVRGISVCKDLQHLDLQDNTFARQGARAMADALNSWADLRTLNLSDCVLAQEDNDDDEDEGSQLDQDAQSPVIATLARGSNPLLEMLQLQNNNLGKGAFAALAHGIPTYLKALKTLELQWNEIELEDLDEDDEDAQDAKRSLDSLAAALKKRGGKLIIDDEDDEEEKEVEEEVAEIEVEAEATKSAEKLAVVPKTLVEQATDALADLMNKVSIH